jgi:anti-sigma regulatory factor (Ser/Thr protein kinase)
MASQPPIARIDFNVDDTLPSLKALLARLSSAKLPKDRPAVLDLADCHYLGPLAVSVLGALMLVRPAGAMLSLVPPKHPPLLAYCQYSGLLQLFAAGPPPMAHIENVTTPLRTFRQRPQSEMTEVVELVRRTMALPEQAETKLQISLAELADNVVYHSNSPVGGLISARAFRNEKEVRFVVADRGIGFRQALLKSGLRPSDDKDAIALAIQDRVTSRSSTHNMGRGLFILVDIVKRNGGALLLVSQKGYLKLAHGRRTFGQLQQPYPGSLALVTLKIRQGESKEAVVDVWS